MVSSALSCWAGDVNGAPSGSVLLAAGLTYLGFRREGSVSDS